MNNLKKNIKECNTIEDLEALDIGGLRYEIGGRGGNLGFPASKVAILLECQEEDLPKYIGCFCNYLGGGVRGGIILSGYSEGLPKAKAILVSALVEACKRAYVNAEIEEGLNIEEYPDGDVNWEALATKAARKAGIVSGY